MAKRSKSAPETAKGTKAEEPKKVPDFLLWRNYRGVVEKCPIDPNNPLVLLKAGETSHYNFADIVYPIGQKGEKPGTHHSEGCITTSSVKFGEAHFIGQRLGIDAMPLKELIDHTGKAVHVILDKNPKTLQRIANNRRAIEAMLKEFSVQKIPENIRNQENLSKIVDSERKMGESGIIFDTLDEVCEALRIYNGNLVIEGSSATEDKLMEDANKAHGPAAAGLLNVFMGANQGNANRFFEKVIADIRGSKGYYSNHFDYDAMGTRLFKTTVEVKQISDKYILKINASYVGDQPEKALAETLKRQRALTCQEAVYNLAPIAGSNWVGVDLGQLFGDILTKKQLEMLSKIAVREARGEDENYHPYLVEIDGTKVKLRLNLEQENYLHPTNLIRNGTRLFLEPKEKGSLNRYEEKYGNAQFVINISAGGSGGEFEEVVDNKLRDKIGRLMDKLDQLVNGKIA